MKVTGPPSAEACGPANFAVSAGTIQNVQMTRLFTIIEDGHDVAAAHLALHLKAIAFQECLHGAVEGR
jgi:hypothetical protein